MTRKRSRLKIFLDVLKAIEEGTSRSTRIMYRTNLSMKPLAKVLESLLEQELIKSDVDGKRVCYEITEKGKNVLSYFNRAMESIAID